jgi:hypothetical protein
MTRNPTAYLEAVHRVARQIDELIEPRDWIEPGSKWDYLPGETRRARGYELIEAPRFL